MQPDTTRFSPDTHPELFESVGLPKTGEDAPMVAKISFWSIVWQQFKKNKLAMAGLGAIFLLIAIAVYAPVLSLDKPFFCYLPGDGWSFPWFVSLFDRNFFENGVDIFFNMLLVLSPLYLAAFFIITSRFKKKLKIHGVRILLGFLGANVLLFLLIVLFGRYGIPPGYYRGIERKIADPAAKAVYLYPLRRFSFRNTDITAENPRPPDNTYWLGTDKEGHDVLARMLYGTRISLTIGVVAVSIYITIGILLGASSGFFGGKIDLVISRFIEIMICFPTFFLILTLAAFIEKPSIFHIMIIIGVTRWTSVARLVRGEFLRLRNIDFVQAAVALGFNRRKIIFSHVLPNALGPVLVAATFGVAASILIESTLSFLGLGDPSAPSWGVVLSDGRLLGKAWLILTPGFAIFFVVSVFNLVGEGLRDALDPKLRQ